MGVDQPHAYSQAHHPHSSHLHMLAHAPIVSGRNERSMSSDSSNSSGVSSDSCVSSQGGNLDIDISWHEHSKENESHYVSGETPLKPLPALQTVHLNMTKPQASTSVRNHISSNNSTYGSSSILTPASVCDVVARSKNTETGQLENSADEQSQEEEEGVLKLDADIRQQAKIISTLLEQSKRRLSSKNEDGYSNCYAIEKGWLEKWKAWVGGELKDPPGPVDNTRLVICDSIVGENEDQEPEMLNPNPAENSKDEGYDSDNNSEIAESDPGHALVPNNEMIEGTDYNWVNEQIWVALTSMNGGGDPVIVTKVNPNVNCSATLSGSWNNKNLGMTDMESSFGENINFLASDPDEEDDVVGVEGVPTAPQWWNQDWDFKVEAEWGLLNEDIAKGAGEHDVKKVKYCMACMSTLATSSCRRCKIARYCSRECQEAHWKYHKLSCSKGLDNSSSCLFFGRKGKTGLSNLGNTCYMNSTIQCLSHTWPLTRYFLNNSAKLDINKHSKLGTGGKLAMVYDSTLKELWFGQQSHISPVQLKRAIGSLPGSGHQFAGFLQHDAQELLVFFLDTLHEDLNKIEQKPYIPQKDYDEDSTDDESINHGNETENAKPDLMVVSGNNTMNRTRRKRIPYNERAYETWCNHLRRERSFVTKLFQGQTQSTLVCPSCNHKSTTFSPFLFLPLAIPNKRDRNITVTLVRCLPGEVSRRCYSVNVPKNDTCRALKVALSELCNVPVNNLWLVDIYKNHIWQEFRDEYRLTAIKEKDVVYAYEVVADQNQPQGNQLMNVVVLHRSNIEHEGGATKTKTESDRLMGTPILLTIPAHVTVMDLRLRILELMRLLCTTEAAEEDEVAEYVKLEMDELELEKMASILPIYATDYTGECIVPETERENEMVVEVEQNIAPGFRQLDSDPTKYVLASDDTCLSEALEEPIACFTIDWNDTDRIPKGWVYDEGGFVIEKHESMRESKSGKASAKGVDLQDCLSHFLKPEQLDGGNTWFCPKCKEDQKAYKSMDIRRLPDVLILFLKRFEHTGRTRTKLQTHVEFPLDGLDMFDHLADDIKHLSQSKEGKKVNSIYDLYAVTNHFGNLGFGHYTAFCATEVHAHQPNSGWCEFDDSRVTPESDPKRICSPAAYVLYYRKRSKPK